MAAAADPGDGHRRPFFLVSIFVLAVFVGYYVVWSVTRPSPPLIVGHQCDLLVIVVGAMLPRRASTARQRRSGRAVGRGRVVLESVIFRRVYGDQAHVAVPEKK